MFNRIKDGMYWDRAWKLVEGCTPVSEGCAHCWSARETHMRANNPNGKISSRNKKLTTKDSVFNGQVRLRVDNLDLPLREKKPTAFAIWNDLFHEDVPWEFIDLAHHAMWEAKQHLFFILTKRADRMHEYMAGSGGPNTPMLKPLPNVWLGVTAENQEQADKRIPKLRQTPAAHRYVSIEPILGPVDLTRIGGDQFGWGRTDALSGLHYIRANATEGGSEWETKLVEKIDFVICGGESGPGARPMHPDWAQSLRDQCQAAGVPYFFKQWGEWSPDNFEGYDRAVESGIEHVDPYVMVRVGKKTAGRILNGREYLQLPEGYCGECSPSDLCPDVCPQGGKRL